jgi:hypothetical protein
MTCNDLRCTGCDCPKAKCDAIQAPAIKCCPDCNHRQSDRTPRAKDGAA